MSMIDPNHRPPFRSIHYVSLMAAWAVATIVGLLVGASLSPKKAQVTVVSQTATETLTNKSLSSSAKMMRLAQLQWGELTQAEVDAITAGAKALPKANITILCLNDDRCGAMALDFDNAFESAKWESSIERPLIDKTKGVAASTQALVDLIDKATAGRIKPSLLPPENRFVDCMPKMLSGPEGLQPAVRPAECDPNQLPRVYLVLGTKPRA